MREAKSDVALKGQLWIDYIEKLRGKIFENQWQLYALCISIGIMYDEQVEFEQLENQNTSVPRLMLNRMENRNLLDYMLQTAVLTTKNLELDEKTRLVLAFGDEKDKDPNFNEYSFLTKFANYGLKVIDDEIGGYTNDIEMMEALMTFLNDKFENGVQPGLDLNSIDFSQLEE